MNFTISNGETLNKSETIQPKGANAIVITNTGDDVAYINNIPIPVFASGMPVYPCLTFCGMEGEILTSTLTLRFAGVGTAPSVVVVRKTYA